MKRLLFSVLTAMTAAAWLGCAPPAGAQEQRVAAVRIVSESGRVVEENPGELPLRAGGPQPSHAAAVITVSTEKRRRFINARTFTMTIG